MCGCQIDKQTAQTQYDSSLKTFTFTASQIATTVIAGLAIEKGQTRYVHNGQDSTKGTKSLSLYKEKIHCVTRGNSIALIALME